jgi:DNA-binding MarR family transcriptional regulator
MPKSPKPTQRPRRSSDAVRRIDAACRRAVLGKLAVRDIASWIAAFGVSETEFRVLWRLLTAENAARPVDSTPCLDQADLAHDLAVSPAQVSAVVDRLRRANLIAAAPIEDRRRQVWRLSAAGHELLSTIVAAVASAPAGSSAKEAA